MTRLHRPTRRRFVSTAAVAAGAALLPSAVLASPVHNAAASAPERDRRSNSREKIPWKVEPFPLAQVRLRKGPCQDALEADRRYLHLLPSERLLHTFRLNAGLPSSAAMPSVRPRLAAISIVVVRALSMISLPVFSYIDGAGMGRFTKARCQVPGIRCQVLGPCRKLSGFKFSPSLLGSCLFPGTWHLIPDT
jgi:hypothetical protein